MPNTFKVKKSHFLCAIVFIIFFFISAFRASNIGNDTINYLELFDKVKNASSFESLIPLFLRFEAGYIFFNYVLSFISKWSQTILIATSFVIMYGYYRFIIKYSKSIFMSLLIFFFLRFFDGGMNVIRQVIAMVIVLKGFDYIIKKDFKRFVFTVFIAFWFHKSAILFVPAYFIAKLDVSPRNILILTIGTVVAYVSFPIIFRYALSLHETYSYYEGSEYQEEGKIAPLINIVIYLMFSVFLWFRLKMSDLKENTTDLIMFKLLLLGVAILVISLNFALLNRISIYYTMFVIVLVPNVISTLKNRDNKFIFQLSLLIFLLTYYLIIIIYRPDWNRVFPYEIVDLPIF